MKLWRHKYELILAALIVCSSMIFLQNLGRPDLTMWDEVVHADVIKHLAQNCCTPILQVQPWGTDYHDWTNTTVWLHKPLLPFYISAVFYKIRPSTLAIRLPTLIGFEFLLILIYFIGRRFFHPIVGLSAVALMAFNIYSFQLVQGTQFSGLGDIGFAFFVLAGVGLVLEYLKNPRTKLLALFGLTMALAYFFKGGLTLIPLGVLGLIVLSKWGHDPLMNKIKNLSLAALIFIIPVGLVSLYLSKHFGAPYAYEQHMQLAHLWQNVEGWGRPWDYYLTVYLPWLLGAWALPWFWYSITSGLLSFKNNKPKFILFAVVVSFFILLSFGVSKVPNFIFAAIPALFILITATAYELWQDAKYQALCGLSLGSVIIYLALRFNLWNVNALITINNPVSQRWELLLVGFGAMFIGLIVAKISKIFRTKFAVKFLLVAAIVLFLWSNIHSDIKAGQSVFADHNQQQSLRDAAKSLSKLDPSNTAVLIDEPELIHNNLYFEFWSNLPAQIVDNQHPLNYWLSLIPKNFHIILISDKIYKIR